MPKKQPKDCKTASEAAKIVEKLWNEIVKKRASNKCELCGLNNCQLHAHHIEAKQSLYMRTSLDNGICLCAYCHMSIHGQNGISEQKKRMNLLELARGKAFLQKLSKERYAPEKLKTNDLQNIFEKYLKLKRYETS